MRLAFLCPDCELTSRIELPDGDSTIGCESCSWQRSVEVKVDDDQQLAACLVCDCPELFVRKKFPQRLGVLSVVVTAVACTIAWAYHMIYLWFGILFAAALIDFILYLTIGNLLQCYRCGAEYRDLAALDSHDAFSLETHERFRQEAARLQEAERANTATDQR